LLHHTKNEKEKIIYNRKLNKFTLATKESDKKQIAVAINA